MRRERTIVLTIPIDERAITDEDLLDSLDYGMPELAEVRRLAELKDLKNAKKALVGYFENRTKPKYFFDYRSLPLECIDTDSNPYVFQAALAVFISPTRPVTPLLTTSNAFCPAAIITPNPIPLVSVLFRLSTYPDAAFIVVVKPLSAADNIAFTLNDSAMRSPSFLQQLSDSGKTALLFLSTIFQFLQFLIIIEELLKSSIHRFPFSFPDFLLRLHGKIKKRLSVFIKILIQHSQFQSFHHDLILSNRQLIHLIE